MEQDRRFPPARDSAQRNRQTTAPAVAGRPERLSDVVENGLGTGCGLCQAVAGRDRIEFITTPEGRERPVERKNLPPDTLTADPGEPFRGFGWKAPLWSYPGRVRKRIGSGIRTIGSVLAMPPTRRCASGLLPAAP